MRIALDAMGGDYAPAVTIEGAIETVNSYENIDIILVGDESALARELDSKRFPPNRITVRHASQVVKMDESPASAIRRKKDSSIRRGIELVKGNEADGFVSAGHSGVVMATALFVLGVSAVVDRPAIAAIMPTLKSPFVLLDAGANLHCKPQNLLQFALMGSTYCRFILGREEPKVALISTGEEDTKGNELTKETFKLLKEADLNFIGNVDGKDIFTGEADVIVCDGFTGNVVLKTSEGLAEAIIRMLKREVANLTTGRIGYLLLKPALRNFKKKTDYDEYGGAPLLGIQGTCIISHGRSTAKAIKNAIRVASDFAQKRVYEIISSAIEEDLSRHEGMPVGKK
ncbi:MAG: plsX [Nitrospirae bacterium]|jgi:glycerol-3-phosphate acyltransferase PlsX|nr:plsX [Nitrospirota bacterium]MBS1233100.1 plsX [Nitrospirota bacterium]